jgi:hypothetical protein
MKMVMKLKLKNYKNINNSMKTIIISIVIFFLLMTSNVYAEWVKKDYVTYFGTTDQSITVKWDAVDNAQGYQLELYHVERDSITKVASEGLTTTQLELTLPRSGHFIPRVRACSDYPACETHSEWSESINSEVAIVDGEARSWWIYGYVAPPGQIIIGIGGR